MKLIHKKEVWLPTVPGLLVLLPVLIVLASVFLSELHPFLKQNKPLGNASVMILEGWLSDLELQDALELADSDTRFVTSGGPVSYGALLLKEKNYAELTASRLVQLGIPRERILAAPAPETLRDRTYVSALAVRDAMTEAGWIGTPANLVSVGVHSRRSGLMYRLAFEKDVPLGTIALESRRCDQKHWWRSSEAFKAVVTECISWMYVQCTRWKY